MPDIKNAIQQPWEKQNIKFARGLLRAEYALGRGWTAHAAYGALASEEYRLRTFGRNLNAREILIRSFNSTDTRKTTTLGMPVSVGDLKPSGHASGLNRNHANKEVTKNSQKL